MKYYEFNDHDYYALIAVDENQVITQNQTIDEACSHAAVKFYVQSVACESVEEVWREGKPREITKENALKQYVGMTGSTLQQAEEYFSKDVEHGDALLIDGLLV